MRAGSCRRTSVVAGGRSGRVFAETETGTLEYLGTAQFWFESFQNWQSEFLAIGSMVVLSVFLRERGSPESKSVNTPHDAHESVGSGLQFSRRGD